jgi:hypothetical protein
LLLNAAVSDGSPTYIQAIYTIHACHVSKITIFSSIANGKLDHLNSSV